jgi:ribosomal protein L32
VPVPESFSRRCHRSHRSRRSHLYDVQIPLVDECRSSGEYATSTSRTHANQQPLQLGDAFTFTPESYSTHPSHRNKVKHLFYLGYSIEKWCKDYPRFLPEDRLNQVYVLAKVSQETTREFNSR